MKELVLASLLLLAGFFNIHAQSVEKLQTAAFKLKMDSEPSKQVVDVRTPDEFASGYIADALNINVYDKDFQQQLSKLDKQKPVFVYCKAGGRSEKAVKQLQILGFTSIYDLDGGMIAWETAKLPITNKPKGEKKNKELSFDEFKSMTNTGKYVLINFYAPWCIPCKEMEPVINNMIKKYADKISIHRIDYDKAPSLCHQLSVRKVPTILIFKDGKEINRTTGFQSEQELLKLVNL